MLGNGINSVLGVLVLIGDIWAIINIFQSSASNEKKLIWIVAVVLLPMPVLVWGLDEIYRATARIESETGRASRRPAEPRRCPPWRRPR